MANIKKIISAPLMAHEKALYVVTGILLDAEEEVRRHRTEFGDWKVLSTRGDLVLTVSISKKGAVKNEHANVTNP